MAKKNSNNTFAGAAIALCMSEEELKKRLDAHNKVQDLEVERDRAIDSAHREHFRLSDLAATIIKTLKPLEEESGALSKKQLINLLNHAKNIITEDDAKKVSETK